MSELKRREFLKSTGKLTAAAVGVSALGMRTVLGANERIRCGVAGIRGRGASHIGGLGGQPGCEIVALCDVDESQLARRVKELDKKNVKNVKTFVDVRHLLEDKSIDVLGIATPNHWHSLMGIWACQAGKDVYVEKPCSHNVFEGRQLVKASRQYGRIIQHGTQIRSSEAIREAMGMIHDGLLGEVYMARGLCYRWRNTIHRTPDEEPPKGVHYDTWLGPAAKKPYSRNRFHYNWHWHWEYGNGDIGNQGVHQLDVARWGLGVGLPKSVMSQGGHFMFDDDQETANAQVTTFAYPDEKKTLVFDVRHWMTNDESGIKVGVLFYGSEGYMVIPSYSKYSTYMGRKGEPGPSRSAGGDHFANFIEAVRSRDESKLNAPIEEGHKSAALCHLANASYRLNRAIKYDPTTERAVGDDEANALLTREYRAPFVVPNVV